MTYTYTQLVQVIGALLPDATFGEDSDGQLIIHTALKAVSASDDDALVAFDE